MMVGVILFYVSRRTEEKIRAILSVEASTVSELEELYSRVTEEAGKGYFGVKCKLYGTVECDKPLTSELAKKRCVYYKMRVEREWEEERTERRRDKHGNVYYETVTHRGSDVVAENIRSVDFWLRNHTGRIHIYPDGAEFDAQKVYEKFEPAESIHAGRITIGSISIVIPAPLEGRRTIGYRSTESIIPVDRPAFILGWASDERGELAVQRPREEGFFIISYKSEREYISSLHKKRRNLIIGGTVAFLIGILLIIMGFLI